MSAARNSKTPVKNISLQSNLGCKDKDLIVPEGADPRSLKIEKWLNSREAAEYLNVTERVLFNLTSNGKVPYYKLGRRNRYLLDDLRNLLFLSSRGGR